VNPRRLDTARIFENLVAVYRLQFTLLAPAALLVFAPVAALNAVIKPEEVEQVFIMLVVNLLASYLLQGMAVEAVRDLQDGRRDFTIPGLFGSVVPVLGSLILAGLVVTIATGLGLALLIVPGLILLTIWAVVAPVIVIERLPALHALGRSRELVRGYGWPVFSVIAVVFLMQLIATQLLAIVLDGVDATIGAVVAVLVQGALVAPVSAIAATLIYLELNAGRPDAPVARAADADA
jgi:hypothetical protein